MLALVRLTAHFPKVVYLLAFDRQDDAAAEAVLLAAAAGVRSMALGSRITGCRNGNVPWSCICGRRRASQTAGVSTIDLDTLGASTRPG